MQQAAKAPAVRVLAPSRGAGWTSEAARGCQREAAAGHVGQLFHRPSGGIYPDRLLFAEGLTQGPIRFKQGTGCTGMVF